MAAIADAVTLWAITSFFNPAKYARRLANFRRFRERLPVPLLAIELAYGEQFELAEDDAEIVLRLRGRDILWQKERLLNLATRALPPECRLVAWLDCDILFERDDWPAAAVRELRRAPLVQLFSRLDRLPAGADPESGAVPVQSLTSFAAASTSGRPAADRLMVDPPAKWTSLGVAWAAPRELLESHGLYDGCIVGGGDRALAAGASGCFDNVIQSQWMNARQQERYLAWAVPFHGAVRGIVGHVEGTVSHLWHGDFEKRRARERHAELAQYGFDPYRDIALAENGTWRWNSDKPALREYVRSYFLSRREDG